LEISPRIINPPYPPIIRHMGGKIVFANGPNVCTKKIPMIRPKNAVINGIR
jgi:hypothetical protein